VRFWQLSGSVLLEPVQAVGARAAFFLAIFAYASSNPKGPTRTFVASNGPVRQEKKTEKCADMYSTSEHAGTNVSRKRDPRQRLHSASIVFMPMYVRCVAANGSQA